MKTAISGGFHRFNHSAQGWFFMPQGDDDPPIRRTCLKPELLPS